MMKVLDKPLPQAFTSPALRNRRHVRSDTPNLAPLMWRGSKSFSDLDRIIYRNATGLHVTNGACIELSGRATVIMLFQPCSAPLASWRRELAKAMHGPQRSAQRAITWRHGTEDDYAVPAACAALRLGETLLIEEKQPAEHISVGERRMLAGLNSGQRQECWIVATDACGNVLGAVTADGTRMLSTQAFRQHIERLAA
jgi:hypothetical protein